MVMVKGGCLLASGPVLTRDVLSLGVDSTMTLRTGRPRTSQLWKGETVLLAREREGARENVEYGGGHRKRGRISFFLINVRTQQHR